MPVIFASVYFAALTAKSPVPVAMSSIDLGLFVSFLIAILRQTLSIPNDNV